MALSAILHTLLWRALHNFNVLHDDLWHREFRCTISYAHLWRALHNSHEFRDNACAEVTARTTIRSPRTFHEPSLQLRDTRAEDNWKLAIACSSDLPVLEVVPSSSRVGAQAVDLFASAPRSRALDLPHTVWRPRPLRTGPVEGPPKGNKHQDPRPTAPETTARTGSVLLLMLPFHACPSGCPRDSYVNPVQPCILAPATLVGLPTIF